MVTGSEKMLITPRGEGGNLSRREFIKVAALGGAGLLVVSCGDDGAGGTTTRVTVGGTTTRVTEVAVQGATPEERALNAFKALMDEGIINAGDTFTMLVPGGSKSNVVPGLEEFEQLTGVKFEVSEADEPTIHTRIITEATARTGDPDIVLHFANWIGDFAEAGFSHEMGPWMDEYRPLIDDPEVGYVSPLNGYLTQYKGSRWALGADNDCYTYFYRRDLFGDPAEKAAFEDKYGYELGIPETWEQFDQIAEFFDRPDEGYRGAFLFANRIFAYINWAARFMSRGGIYMDRDMVPQLLNDTGVTALEEMTNLAQNHMAPEAITGSWPALYEAFPDGRVVQATSWISLGKFANDPATETKIAGNAGGGLIPGSMVNGRLVHATPHVVGWVFGVSRHGDNPLAMYLLAQWLSGPQKGNEMALRTGILDPWRINGYNMPEMREAYGEELIEALLANTRVAFPDIGLKGAAEYMDVLNEQLQEAMAGRQDAETALENVENAWTETTDRLGRDEQTAAWRAELANYPKHLRDLWGELGHNV